MQATEYSTQHLQISLMCAQSSEESTSAIPVNPGALWLMQFGIIAQNVWQYQHMRHINKHTLPVHI